MLGCVAQAFKSVPHNSSPWQLKQNEMNLAYNFQFKLDMLAMEVMSSGLPLQKEEDKRNNYFLTPLEP